jgi:hypothetical protein
MKASVQNLLVCAVALVMLCDTLSHAQVISSDSALTSLRMNRQMQATYGDIPLAFEANHGQTGPQVKFLAHTPSYNVFLSSGQMVLSIRPSTIISHEKGSGTGISSSQTLLNAEGRPSSPGRFQNNKTELVRLSLIDSNQNAEIAGEDRQPGIVNYFIGNRPEKWRTKIPTYKRIRYKNIYPGIDLLYYGNQSRVEHDFIVAPGADPIKIELGVEGVDSLNINSNGDLILTKGKDAICFRAPKAYQESNGVRTSVTAGYVISNATHISFSISQYNRTLPLIIDPVLVYSTFLGGSMDDAAVAVQVDSSGNAYVAGYTDSVDFPGTLQNGPPPSGMNTFVAKLDATGSNLIYADYIGGTGDDYAFAMVIDASGDALLTGNTGSTDFPTVEPYQAQNSGTESAFVTKISPDGSSLLYATYLGGTAASQGNAIGLDGSGNIYVAGSTYAIDFPTSNAYQTTVSPNQNGDYGEYGFVAEFTPDGSSLIYSTYLAGNTNLPQSCQAGTCWPSPYNTVTAMAVDANGDAYVAGSTNTYNFPVTDGAYQTSNSTSWNQDVGFICKYTQSGTIGYCTYYGALAGTSNYLYPSAIAVDSAGSPYVVGSTSPWNIPITTPNICGPQNGNCDSGFITKFDSAGAAVLYSTYLSSGIFAVPWSLFVDANGDAYVSSVAQTGWISLVDPIESYAGGRDLYIQEIDPTGGALIFSTFMGGSEDDYPGGIAVDSGGSIYLTGFTYSVDYPVTAGALQATLAGQMNVFVSKIDAAMAPAVTLTASFIQYPVVSVGSASQSSSVELRNMGSMPLAISRITTTGDFSESDTCSSGVAAAGTCSLAVTFAPKQPGQRLGSIIIEDNAQGSPHTIALVGTGFAGIAQISTSELTFSTQAVGTASAAQSVTVSNTGNNLLTFSGIQTTGDFAQSNNCSSLAANGGSCSIQITFKPSSSGTRTGALILTDSAADSPQLVTLTGEGTDFSMPSSAGSATVDPGASATYNLSILPVGGAFSTTIHLSCANLPPFSTCIIQPSAVNLGGSSKAVQVTVSTAGSVAQSLAPRGNSHALFAWVGLFPGMGLLGMAFLGGRGRQNRTRLVLPFCAFMVVLLCASCGVVGGSSSSGQHSTPAGNYTVLLIGRSGNLQHSSSLSLTVQ